MTKSTSIGLIVLNRQKGIGLGNLDTEANKAVVQRYIDEIQNGHSLEVIADVFAEDFIDHTASGGGAFVGGIEGLKQGYAIFLEAFPDLHADVEKLIAEGDTVVAYKTLTATHAGEWLGSRLIDLQPEQHGSSESDGREEYLWASVISGGNPPPVLQATEHDLNAVAAFVATLVVPDRLVA